MMITQLEISVFDGMKEIRGKYLNLVQVPHSSLRDMHAHYVAHLIVGLVVIAQ